MKFLIRLFLLVLPLAAAAQSRLPPCPAGITANWHNCFGTETSASGAKFVGEWKDGKMHGRGTLTWPDRRQYIGEWLNGRRHGEGTALWPDGRKYIGEIQDEKASGHGTFSWPNGNTYVGEWRNDRRNGFGVFSWPDGRRFVGEYRDNKRSGLGIEYLPDGSVGRSGRWVEDNLASPFGLDTARFALDAASRPVASNSDAGRAERDRRVAHRLEPFKAAWIYVGPVGEFGWSFTHDQGRKAVEAKFGDAVKTTFIEKVPEGADAERVIRDLAQQGNKVIFATSFGYMEPMLKVAADFPDVKFEHATGYKTAPNMRVYDASFYQSAYMAGVIAGRMTKTNVLGFVGSFPIPEVLRNINAFTLGAQSVNPKIRTKVVWVNTWFEPVKEAVAAQALINQQADVLLQNTDSTAVLETAEKNGKYAFGWDSDMSSFGPKAHLGSAIVDWAPYYIKAIEEVKAGTWRTGRTVWGVKEGLNDLIKISNLVTADARTRVDGVRAGLKNGSFSVFAGPIIDRSGRQRLAAGRLVEQRWLDSIDFYVQGVEGRVPGEATANSSDPSSSSVASSLTAAEAEAARRKQQELEQRLAAETRERERQTVEAEAARRRQQELERQLAQEARDRERLTAETAERSRLAAEAEATRRRQQELEARLAALESQSASRPSNQAAIIRNQRRVALVIGNASYKVSPLDNPVNDATDVDQTLRQLGFQTTLVRNATLGQMREATRRFADQLAAADVALIYFAGHGIESNRKNYMIPVNADLKFEYELDDQAYNAGQWLEMLESIKSSNAERVNIVILDACRNNSLIGARSLGRGLGRMDAPTGTFLAYSTAPGKVAADGARGQRNSPFTRHLLTVMQQPGLPIEEAFKEVRRNVSRETNGAQVPWESTSLTGFFTFRQVR